MRARLEDVASIHAADGHPTSTGVSIAGVFHATSRAAARMSATRANGWAGLVADVAVSLALIWLGLRRYDSHVSSAVGAILSGLLAFSFVEYAFHRWLFHGHLRVIEEGHRKHHDEPRGYDSLPFFLAPLLMLTLAAALACVLPTTIALLSSGALATGYAAYGSSHLAIHFMRFRHPLPRRWAAAHHVHHFHPDTNFGVTSPLWDIILGTRYVSRGNRRNS